MISKLEKFYPNLGESWLLTVIIIIGGGLLSALAVIVIALITGISQDTLTLILYPLMFLPGWLYIRAYSPSRISVEGRIPINASNFGKIGSTLTFAAVFLLVPAVNLISEPLHSWMEMPDFIKNLFGQINESSITAFITVSVFAPFFEELLCRGIILRGLLRYSSPAKAIIWSSVIFGFMHLNPWQAIPAIIVGVLMGWLYYKTGSLLLSMFVHFVNNTISFAVVVFMPGLPADATFKDIIPQNLYWIVFLFASIFVITLIVIFNKFYDKPLSVEIQPDNQGESMGGR